MSIEYKQMIFVVDNLKRLKKEGFAGDIAISGSNKAF
jgi:hypothetical protein